MMIKRKRRGIPDLEEAKQELAEAQDRGRRAEDHQAEVVRVTEESKRHLKGNGFYDLFKRGLTGGA